MLLYREPANTIKHVEMLSRKDARSYEKFRARWARVNAAIGKCALDGPASFESILAKSGFFPDRSELNEVVQESKLPAANILSENFETDYVSSLIAFLGPAAVGLSPAAPNTGWLCAWHLGAERLARPVGGSGELTRALAASAKANGATILTGERVSEIMIQNGKAIGIKTTSGKVIESTFVVSNADPKQTLLKLARAGNFLSTDLYRQIEYIRVTPGFTFKADYLLSDLPDYLCKPLEKNRHLNESHTAATFIAPSVEALSLAHKEFSSGKNPKEPGLMVAIHSSMDRSLVPEGKQGLVLETRFTPYKLYGLSWMDSDKEAETERLLALYSQYCPGVDDLVEETTAKCPQDMESDVMIPQGNFMHADMKFEQMFDSRPSQGLLDGYEVAAVPNLYLCGAGTFPGGGVSGIPGRNAALQILSNISAQAP
jgi:phytoene dehydrogenase-like protein